MMRSALQTLTLLGAAGLMAVGPLSAQRSTHGGMTMDSTMHMDSAMSADTTPSMGQPDTATGGMMGMMSMMHRCSTTGARMHTAQMALAHRKQLDLSATQVQKLEALQDDAKQAMMQAMHKMQPLQQQLITATTGNQFDEQAVRGALEKMSALHSDAAVAMLRTSFDARRVLTPEQRESLAKAAGGMMGKGGTTGMQGMTGMRGMTGGGMHGGMSMQGCSTMHGGSMDGMPMHGSDSTSTQHELR